jgi:acetylornithine deacetylase
MSAVEGRLSRVLGHLEGLVARDTRNPPRRFDVEGLATWLRSRLGAGFVLTVTDLGEGCVNFLAVRGAPKLLCNVHLDTVPLAQGWTRDPFALAVEGGWAFGLGACDIKGAAACLLAAAEETEGDAAFLFSTDEEAGQSRCVREFLRGAHGFEAALVSEPTQGRAVVAHRGIASARGVFSGVAGHASSARALEDSALHEAARWTHRALALSAQEEQVFLGGLPGIRFNLGHMEGGTKPNMIADEARVWWGVRSRPGEPPAQVRARVQALAPDPARVVWQEGFTGPSLPADDPDGRVAARARALADGLGLSAGGAVDFWTEASLFSEAGLQAVVFGPGDIAHAHAPDERVSLDELVSVTDAYVRLLGGAT